MVSFVMLNVFMLSVIMMSIIMLSVIMLSIIMLSVILLSVIMLSVAILSAIMMSLIMVSLIMLSVVAPYIKLVTGVKSFVVKVPYTLKGLFPIKEGSGQLVFVKTRLNPKLSRKKTAKGICYKNFTSVTYNCNMLNSV
jgi:hypothetical protein